MRVLVAEGAGEVARLLRALADEVEAEAAGPPSRSGDAAGPVRAMLEVVDATGGEVVQMEVRLTHPFPRAWDLTRLRVAMAPRRD